MFRIILPVISGMLLVLAAAYLPSAAPPPLPPQGDWQAFDDYATALIGREMARSKLVGVSAVVVDENGLVWARGFGLADAASGVPATPDTVYRTGSVAKLLNAVAVLQLCDEGRLDLDRPLAAYVPEFSIKSRFSGPPVTFRHLLTHHSGLPSDLVGGMWGDNPPPFATLVDKLREEYAAYPPGYIHAYSNVGSCLAGIAVERVAGESYAAYLDRRVLRPLGMLNSSFALRPDIADKLSKGYNKAGQEEPDVTIRDVPAGGLFASAVDLGKFLTMLFNGGRSGDRQVLSPAAAAEMLRAQPASPLDGTFRIGLEFFLEYPELAYAGRIAGHGGETYLFRSHVVAVPDHKLGVVVLTNSAGASSRATIIELVKAAIAVKTGLTPPAEVRREPFPLPGTPVRDPSGYYGTAAGLAKVAAAGERLKLEVLGRIVRLTPAGDGWYTPELMLGGIVPVPVAKLKDMAVAFRSVNGEDIVFLREGAKVRTAGKRAERTPIPASWLRYLGQYDLLSSEERQIKLDSFRIALHEGFLVAVLAAEGESGRFVLQPVSEDEAVLFGLGRRMMETMTAAGAPGEERLHFAGLVFRKIQAKEYIADY